ncbi:MAG TPA: hypothetical protein VMU04_21105 [Candidatus Acidoferrum sp.]|nr:hypothetical protein [Candidatus Acidoferrum sp.]
MKLWRRVTLLGAITGPLLFACGCAGPDVNPSSPHPGRGYVDLFTQPKKDVWWKVDVFDARQQGYKEFTAEFKAPGQEILRVQARPGVHKARISFVNQAIQAPAEVEVEVREGMITPVEVKLTEAGSSYVRDVEDRAVSGFRTAGRNKVTDYPQQVWQITATALPPIPYTPKENTTYWK